MVGTRYIEKLHVFFYKQKTAYEFGTGDWSSDVCSSDLDGENGFLFRNGFVDRLTFGKEMGHWLFAIDILAIDRKSVV